MPGDAAARRLPRSLDARLSPEVRRPPEQVMRLARLGSFHHSRLSFMRTLLRRLRDEGWQFDRPVWDLDANGVGRAVYRAAGPARTYSLVCFGHDLPDDQRSDRVIATAWDTTFALFDGEPTVADLDRLAQHVPKQEAGRLSQRELCLSRANRSVRIFEHVVDRLASGRQPDAELIEQVGYLMRTTAVYGFGKFGAADREGCRGRDELRGPFRAEMLTVYLIRCFSVDLVEHLAQARGGEDAAGLEPERRRRLGIGNSTGLGMAPFLITHPILLNNWIQAREVALGRVLSQATATSAAQQRFRTYLQRAQVNARGWNTSDSRQQQRVEVLRNELAEIERRVADGALAEDSPWDALYRWAEETLSMEGQEQLVSLMMEPYPELVDGLTECMDADEEVGFAVDGTMTIGELRELLQRHYGWATGVDYRTQAEQARFWYVSEEKLEPRLGERFDEPGAELELPLGIGRDVATLADALTGRSNENTVTDFLAEHPQLRHVVRRVQRSPLYPYGEIHDNLLSAEMLPIDLLRCKLSFFGATKFDPRSDRWVRICMYQGAPFPDELVPQVAPPQETCANLAVESRLAVAVDDVAGAGDVTCSLAELEVLGRKAARGAGCEWGEAEEAGRAVRWLASFGLPGPSALATLCREADRERSRSEHASAESAGAHPSAVPVNPLFCGPSIAQDLQQILSADPYRLGEVLHPMFLLPYVSLAFTDMDAGARWCWPDAEVECSGDGVSIVRADGLYAESAADVRVMPIAGRPEFTGARLGRCTVERQTWQELERFAARTYVPATEASRMGGAGAGSADADRLD